MNGTNLTIDDQTRLIRRYETEARRVKERACEKLKALQDAAAALEKQAREREAQDWMDTYLVGEPIPQDKIDKARGHEASPPAPALEPEAQPEAPVVPVEDAQVSPAVLGLETIADLEKTLRLAAVPAAPETLPVTAPRPLTRRARKVLAARAAHRGAR